jgi:hypothetical protein
MTKNPIIRSIVGLIYILMAGCGDQGMLKEKEKIYLQVVERLKTGELKTDKSGTVNFRRNFRLPALMDKFMFLAFPPIR